MVVNLVAERKVGDRFEGGSKVITRAELNTFCQITGMQLDALLNDEAARALGFKSRLVPGAFMFALAIGLLGELLDGHMHVAADNVKVRAPLYPGDSVKVEGSVLRKKETSKGDRIFVTWSWALKNQDDVTIAQGENT
jgi:acyl dehydratase